MSENQTQSEKPHIGYVISGGLKDGFHIRLEVDPDKVQEGAFVVTESINDEWLFYGLVVDLQLGAIDPRYADASIKNRLSKPIAEQLNSETLYTNLQVMPALMLEKGPKPGTPEYDKWRAPFIAGLKDEPRPLPVKTVPPHHSKVRMAEAGDIAEIFGDTNKKSNFVIGYTREQGHPVALDMEKFVQRSSGVFGATGTGKSFLTRLVLAGLIQYNKASVMIFDMHNEYGFDDTASDTGLKVIGFKSKFPSRVRVVGLGGGAMIRNNVPDFNLEIASSDITPEDIELLSRELNLKETTATTLDALATTFGRDKWYAAFKEMKIGSVIETEDGKKVPAPDSVAFWANKHGVNVMAAEGLHSKLRRVFGLDYIVEKPAADSLREIIKALKAGQHIVLSFARHESDLDYLLVSNLLTRRIKQVWEDMANDFRSSGDGEPRPLVIVVEEAHKLLNREMASQTSFSTIARELRKYYVTLLIIDQRPSQIYDEVMSQLGTRVSGWLGDDDDIRAVLSGLSGREALRGMLARLQPKEEVMLMGWGVPMPLPVRSRRYDDKFWEELLGKKSDKKSALDNIKELGF